MCSGASSHRSNSKAVGGERMTHEEIIAMANAAAARHGHTYEPEPADGTVEFLTSFAALVAAKEREACAQVCDSRAHEVRLWCNESNVIACAAAIRARGQKEGA